MTRLRGGDGRSLIKTPGSPERERSVEKPGSATRGRGRAEPRSSSAGAAPRRPHGARRRRLVPAPLPARGRPVSARRRPGAAFQCLAAVGAWGAGRATGAGPRSPHRRPSQRPYLHQGPLVGQGGSGGSGVAPTEGKGSSAGPTRPPRSPDRRCVPLLRGASPAAMKPLTPRPG